MASTPFPATVQYAQLQTGSAPTGPEIVAVVQGGASVQLTLAQIATSVVGTGTLPLAGSTGQLLAKNSSNKYDTGWYQLSTFLSAGSGLSTAGSTAMTVSLASVAALSVLGVTGAAQATSAPIAGIAAQVLRVNDAGAALAFGALNLGSAAAVTGQLPIANVSVGVLPGANYSAANLAAGNVAGGVQGVLPFANGGIGAPGGLQSAILGFLTATTVTRFPAGQLPGSLTSDAATAGNVGEFLSTTRTVASALNVTTDVATTVASLSLSAGDWNVWSVIGFTGGVTTKVFYMAGSVSATTAVLSTTVGEGSSLPGFGLSAFTTSTTTIAVTPAVPVGPVRKSLSGTTSIFLTAQMGYTTSTAAAWGSISARRVR